MIVTRGRLIILEGPESAGKSTQLFRLADHIRRAERAPVVVREPGGTLAAESIRALLLDPTREITSRSEALLFMASRADLVERVIRPALAAGEDVLMDRFFLSTYAYQIAGRELPERDVRAANHLATGGLIPDLTILLECALSERLDRLLRKGGHDRIESAGDDFHQRVDSAFTRSLDAGWQAEHPECGPIVAVNGAGDEDKVFHRVLRALAARWPETFAVSMESHS